MADISQIKLPDGNIHNIVDNTSGYITAESPALTGTPTAPTPLSEASDTQIATVKYVRDSMAGAGAGSVTSVGIANATEGGLSVSGSPITGAGTITVGHSNVLASAQTTAGIYPIKIDKNGHISEYGNAVSIPIKTSDLTNDSGFITSQYIEDKTDYEIPVSRVGEIIVGETPIGTDSTNFPTSKAVVDYVDERVTQEIAAIDFEGSITDIKANGTSLPINNGVVNIPAIGPGQSVGLMTNEYMLHIFNSIPHNISDLYNDSGFVTSDEKLAVSRDLNNSAVYEVVFGRSLDPINAETKFQSKKMQFSIFNNTASLSLGNNSARGELQLYGPQSNYSTRIRSITTTDHRTVYLQDKDGTIALTSDIPTVPTNISAFTNDSGYITTDSDEKLKTNLITNSEKYYPIFGKSTTNAETKYYDSNISYSTGSGAFSLLTLGSSSKSGSLQLRSSNGGSISLNSDPNSTTAKDIYFQDKNGTVALTSDIPTVPTNISSFTNDSGYLTASDIASVMTYKGTKANYAALPSTGNTIGDVWHLTDTGAEWAWDGSAWQELGSAISVDGYVESSKTVDGTITNFSNSGITGSIQSIYQGTNNETYIQTTASNDGASIELYASDGINSNQILIASDGTFISSIVTPVDDTDAANKKYVDDSIGAISIPTKTSDLTNDSGFLTSYTETDPTVPSWAKASSKPSYSLTEISGTDDLRAIEALTGTSGLLQKTAANTWTLDTNTYLTSYTETDPVFSASAAAGITATDISNWNGKSSTDEKVKQTASTDDVDLRVLLSHDANNTEATNTIYKTGSLTFNPGTKILTLSSSSSGGSKKSTWKYNELRIGTGGNAYQGIYKSRTLTADRTYNFPDASGTVALTSDIPSVYSSTNTGGYLTMATLPIYDGTVV